MLEKIIDIIFRRKPYLIRYEITTWGVTGSYTRVIKANSESEANYKINNQLRLLDYKIISIEQLPAKGVIN